MFTGITTHLGKVINKSKDGFTIETDTSLTHKLEKGASVSVNGICLTVLDKPVDNKFTVEVMPETWKLTMLGKLVNDNIVNLELPVTAVTFLSGHIVQGHIDGVGVMKKITTEGNSKILTITVDAKLNKYIVKKGFIAVNGISLTVIDITDSYFTVGIIPFTWGHTMLHTLHEGDQVNIEIDIFAKYVEKLLTNKLAIQK